MPKRVLIVTRKRSTSFTKELTKDLLINKHSLNGQKVSKSQQMKVKTAKSEVAVKITL